MVYIWEHFVNSTKMLLVSKYYWCSGRLVGPFVQSKFWVRHQFAGSFLQNKSYSNPDIIGSEIKKLLEYNEPVVYQKSQIPWNSVTLEKIIDVILTSYRSPFQYVSFPFLFFHLCFGAIIGPHGLLGYIRNSELQMLLIFAQAGPGYKGQVTTILFFPRESCQSWAPKPVISCCPTVSALQWWFFKGFLKGQMPL